MVKSAVASVPLLGLVAELWFTDDFMFAPSCTREKVAGLWLGNMGLNRLPKARRLIPVDGEIIVAPSSCQNPGLPPSPSSTRPAIRKSASPKKLPPMPLANWSLMEGFVVSPPVSQRKLPTLV